MMSRFLNMLALGRISFTDETGPIAVAQVDQGALGADRPRLLDKLVRWTHFGFAAVPPNDSDALMVALGGLREQSMVLATNHQASRPKNMKSGDARIYDIRGAMIDLSEDGMLIDAAGLQVTVRNASKVRLECDLFEVTGDVVSRADGSQVSLNRLRDAYEQHHHTQVKAGTDTSGPTDSPA